MIIATGLYLVALFLITLFTEAAFGIHAQSLAYGPLTLALLVLVYTALTAGPRSFLRRWYTSSPMLVPGLLFLAGLAASIPNARDVGLAAKDLLRWSFVWLVYAPVTRALCDDRRRCALFARATAGFVILFGALGVADLLAGRSVTQVVAGVPGVSPQGRHQSLYATPGIFAGMLIVAFPLALVPALSDEAGWRRLAWGAGAVVLATGMLLSGSRAAVVCGIVAALVVGLAQRRRWLVVGLAAAVVAAAGLIWFGELRGPPALARFGHVATRAGTGTHSLQRRMLAWSVAGELIEESPLIGLGGSQFRYHQHSGFNRAHNAWLDAWLDGGLLAAVAMLLVARAVLLRGAVTVMRRPRLYVDPTHVAWLAACVAVLVGWTVRAGIGSRIDWLPVFMLFSLCWEPGPGRRTEDAHGDGSANKPGGEEVFLRQQGS